MNLIEQKSDPHSNYGKILEPYVECDLAYAAGYFDGEGSINVLSSKKGSLLRIEIRSYDLDALFVFKKLFGGALLTVKWASSPHAIFRWARNNSEALDVLNAMLPFLRAKRKQAELVIGAGWDTGRSGGRILTESQKEKRTALKLALQDAKKQYGAERPLQTVRIK